MAKILRFPQGRAMRCPPGAWVQHPDYTGEALVVGAHGPRRRIRLMIHFPDEATTIEGLPSCAAHEVLCSETILFFEIEVAASSLWGLSPCRDVGRLPPDWQVCAALFHEDERDARPAPPRLGAAWRPRLVPPAGARYLDRKPLS